MQARREGLDGAEVRNNGPRVLVTSLSSADAVALCVVWKQHSYSGQVSGDSARHVRGAVRGRVESRGAWREGAPLTPMPRCPAVCGPGSGPRYQEASPAPGDGAWAQLVCVLGPPGLPMLAVSLQPGERWPMQRVRGTWHRGSVWTLFPVVTFSFPLPGGSPTRSAPAAHNVGSC